VADDELLDPNEIESLLNSSMLRPPAGGAGVVAPPGAGAPTTPPAAPPAGAESRAAAREPAAVDPEEIERLLKMAQRSPRPDPGAILQQVNAGLAAAVAPELKSRPVPKDLESAKPYELAAFDRGPMASDAGVLHPLQDVELDVSIELGRTELLIEEVLRLKEGSVVPLDKLAGDPVDILVNGQLIGRGEVLVLNDNFCVRVAEILAPAV